MFDYRYHALSLAAVLLALAVGVVIGVAIGDSNLVSSAKSGIVHDLSSEVNGADREAGQLRTQLADEEAFANDLYPIAVHGLLAGRDVGLVFLGASSDRVNGLVREAVTDAGGNLMTVVAVHEPLNLAGLANAAAGTRYAALDAGQPAGGERAAPGSANAVTSDGPTQTGGGAAASGADANGGEGRAAHRGGGAARTGAAPSSSTAAGGTGAESSAQLVQRFGALVGRQLVSGGQLVNRELLSRVRSSLLSAFDGRLGKLAGLVLVRADPTDMTVPEAQASVAFESGLLAGVAAAGVPVVGVELSRTEPSQVPWYESKNISSVDDLDATAGQAALIYALMGSRGAYGTKPTADSLLPDVVGPTGQP
jgi:Copper transport outer membrane protein, MctB